MLRTLPLDIRPFAPSIALASHPWHVRYSSSISVDASALSSVIVLTRDETFPLPAPWHVSVIYGCSKQNDVIQSMVSKLSVLSGLGRGKCRKR
jgi:hypothetical protein